VGGWLNTPALDVSPVAYLGLKDQTTMIGHDVRTEAGGTRPRRGFCQSLAMNLRALLRSCRVDQKVMDVPSTPKARAVDYVEYDPYGGVRIDLARWLRSEAGQNQLKTLKNVNKADKTSPAEPKK
jgi:hypothetical protein